MLPETRKFTPRRWEAWRERLMDRRGKDRAVEGETGTGEERQTDRQR